MIIICEHQSTVREGDIEDALKAVAQLIDLYGLKYWPVFERLEDELASLRSRENRLSAALSLNAADARDTPLKLF